MPWTRNSQKRAEISSAFTVFQSKKCIHISIRTILSSKNENLRFKGRSKYIKIAHWKSSLGSTTSQVSTFYHLRSNEMSTQVVATSTQRGTQRHRRLRNIKVTYQQSRSRWEIHVSQIPTTVSLFFSVRNILVERMRLQVCVSITLMTVETHKRPCGTMQKVCSG